MTLFLCFSVFSQKETVQFKNYTISDGLSQSYITSILQDNLGYIWIGTQDGLNKFDGQNFTIFQNIFDDDNSVSNNYIHCIEKDKKGNLWIGTDQGLNQFEFKSQSLVRWHFESTKKINNKIITSIAFDEDNNPIVSTEKNGLYKLNIVNKTINKYKNQLENKTSLKVYNDHLANLVLASKEGVFYRNNQKKKIPNDCEFNNLSIDLINNESYICSDKGLFKIINDNLTEVDAKLNKYNIQGVVFDGDLIWIATNSNGLINYNKKTKQISEYNPSNNKYKRIINNYLNTIFKDNTDVIWLGTENGISKFDSQKRAFNHVTTSVDKKEGILDDHVWTIDEDKHGNLWIGTKTAVTNYKFSDNTFTHYPLPLENNQNSSVYDFYIKDTSEIWVATNTGVYILNINKTNYAFNAIQFKNDISPEKVYDLELMNDSIILIGSNSGIAWVNVDNKKYHFEVQNKNNELGSGAIKNIFKIANRYYIFPKTGILELKLDNIGKFHFSKAFDEVQVPNRIFTYALEKNDILWLGTYGSGLIAYNLKTKKIEKHYTEATGLPNNVIYAILSGTGNSVWISTNRGLAKIDDNKIYKYTQADGLQSNEFNSSSAFKSKEGILYFGGINGYNWFNTNEVKRNEKAPRTVIESIKIFNEDVENLNIKGLDNAIEITNKIVLKHNQNSLTFHLAALHFSDPDGNQFKLKMEGIDDEFRITKEPIITYTALPPGNYRLIISSSNSDGVWSDPIYFDIEILTPFWSTWWFRILVILILVLIIVVAYRKRIDNIRRQKIKLELMIIERTREIREQKKKIEKQKKEVESANRKMKEQNRLVEIEKNKVEELLLNILPEDTARELRDKGKARARDYRRVSIMFTDFVGFTKKAEAYKPSELVEKLDNYFSRFDKIIEKFNLEKIKTIGDAYMCAGGIPIRNKTNPIETVLAGLEIQYTIATLKKENKDPDDPIWDLRIGINTGEIVAGVIGSKRFAYDIWGQSVNLANRMEMHGESGKVNISDKTFEYIEPYFECTFRGKIKTKSSGYVNMYFVERIKPELSADDYGVVPNDKFWKIVNLHNFSSINYMKAERFIMKELEDKLSPKLYYHSIDHTKDVTSAAERLAIMEGITDEGLFVLKSAATYHDAGFVEQYDHNEPIGVRMSREILPKYGYTNEQIEDIAGLIYATKIPHKPQSLLQQIICDADLDYLGRDDFHEIADRLRIELREHGKIDSDRLWDEIQVKFLTQHQYFTNSAVKLRQEKKEKHIQEIKDRLERNEYKD